MSSTSRGAKRRQDDFYATPAWCTRALLSCELPDATAVRDVLDPCAGDGAILRVVHELLPFARTHAVELRGEALGELRDSAVSTALIADALLGIRGRLASMPVITNPPYSMALRFVQKFSERPFAAFLLRLNFLGSKKRCSFWQTHPPARIHVLSSRPSFTGGKTDSCEYAWFVWDQSHTGPTHIDVLDPKEEWT